MARFNRKGITVITFVPTIASTTYLPTRAELDAGTELTKSIAAIEGFGLENQEIETPDMASTFVSKIPGDDTATESTMTVYEDDLTDEMETVLAKGTAGFIVIMSKGDVPSSPGLDSFPIRVASNSKAYTAENEAAKINVRFSIIDRPLFNAAVPAAV